MKYDIVLIVGENFRFTKASNFCKFLCIILYSAVISVRCIQIVVIIFMPLLWGIYNYNYYNQFPPWAYNPHEKLSGSSARRNEVETERTRHVLLEACQPTVQLDAQLEVVITEDDRSLIPFIL